jgi:hydroxyethylthiazole kinase-like uncharacterized protein yjeF
MKILSSEQIRSADAYTIANEPVSSIHLMERAATACTKWIKENISHQTSIRIFCGPGNNGGDGLAIARLLLKSGYKCQVFIPRVSDKYSSDFLENEKRLHESFPDSMNNLKSENDFPLTGPGDVIIDALFGTGLSKPVEGLNAKLIEYLNNSGAETISIDTPSGLYIDQVTKSSSVIHAHHTLTFHSPKFSFLFPGNEKNVGDFHVLDIGLDKNFIESISSMNYFLTKEIVQSFLKQRSKFSHKGTFGHALIAAGSKGKMGAAVLAVKGALRSGVGLVSAVIPSSGIDIMQISCPEAMVVTRKIDLENYSAVGVGPGIGTDEKAIAMLDKILKQSTKPLVLDADALNIILKNKKLLKKIPANSILTPHPKEFERLAGKTKNDFERHQLQLSLSKKYNVVVVLKGAYTCIITPEGKSFFNSTGNPGMAKGGSGDVLTGMIISLLAQGYTAEEAALLGVYLHGLAGDIAAEKKGMDGMVAGDLVEAIQEAWMILRKSS